MDVEWCGARWHIDEAQDHANSGMARCTVTEVLVVAAGWHVGDHCYLTHEELHPSNPQLKIIPTESEGTS